MKHWFECLSDNLNEMSDGKREFVLNLIKNPFGVSEADIRLYVSKELSKKFLMLKKFFLYSLNGKPSILNKSAYNFEIKSYFINNNGNTQIIDNHNLIFDDYKGRIKEDLVKNGFPPWDKLTDLARINIFVFYALSDLIIYKTFGILEKDHDNSYLLNKEYYFSYKMMWFSRYFTQHSHAMDSLMQKSLGVNLTSRYD